MATQFYLTLPSNSSMAYFPNNTVANFRVKLAETIDLPGQWEVALVGLHYPHTWPTIKKGVQQTFLYNLGAGLKDETAILKEVYYPSLEQLIKALNASMSKEAQAKIKFSYNPSSRKVTVDVKRGATIWFTGDIAAVLGFAQDCFIEKKTSSPYTADINGGFSSLYVYTDIVDPQFVGDVKVPVYKEGMALGVFSKVLLELLFLCSSEVLKQSVKGRCKQLQKLVKTCWRGKM